MVTDDRFIADGMSAFERNVKRMVDCAIAAVCLIVFSPLFLFCYVMVKREDGGPALFKQERIGRFGRPFNIYKFRSMRIDAEKMLRRLRYDLFYLEHRSWLLDFKILLKTFLYIVFGKKF